MLIVASEEQADGPPRTPAGTSHAFREGDSSTLCGRPLAHHFIFPEVDFGNVFLQGCRECALAAAAVDRS